MNDCDSDDAVLNGARAAVHQATVDATARALASPTAVIVSWDEVRLTTASAHVLLEAVGRRVTAPSSSTSAAELVADLETLLAWASVSSDASLFERVRTLTDAAEAQGPLVPGLAALRASPAWLRLSSSPADAFEIIKLSYLAQPEYLPPGSTTQCMLDGIRWHTAQLMSSGGGVVAMQDIRVEQLSAGPVEVFVCVRYGLEGAPLVGDAAPSSPPFADAMDPAPPPPGYSWVRRGSALLLFASKWTDRNVDWAKVPLALADDGLPGAGHAGFVAMLREVWPRVLEALGRGRSGADAPTGGGALEFLRGGDVWLLGHSMGGALATLAAPRLVALLAPPPALVDAAPPQLGGQSPPLRIHLLTTGCPRVLDAEAAAAFSALPGVTAERFFLPGDAIHHLPPQWRLEAGHFEALGTLTDTDAFLAERLSSLAASRWWTPPRLDLCGFAHVGAPRPRSLPAEEAGWLRPWRAWAAGGFSQPQFRRLHDNSYYRRADDSAPQTPLRYPWPVQLALGLAALWGVRVASGRLRRAFVAMGRSRVAPGPATSDHE